MRKIFAAVLIVLGLGTVAAAIASGTIWRPDDRVTLTLPADPDVPLIVTEPGVLNAVNNSVQVRVVGATPTAPIVLAMSSEADVMAWVGDAPHWSITGLADWETLSYSVSEEPPATEPEQSADPSGESTDPEGEGADTEGEGAQAEGEGVDAEVSAVPNPSGSDLWVEEIDGEGELTYNWTAVPGRWVMLVATDGTAPAPQVELTWEREVTTPFLRPGIILGSIVALLGMGLMALFLLSDREQRRNRRAAAASVATPVMTTDGDQPLTRRELRAAMNGSTAVKESSQTPADDRDEHDDIGSDDVATAETTVSEDGPATELILDPIAGDDQRRDQAGELDAWIRTGAASPGLHDAHSTTPADLLIGNEEEADAQGGAQAPVEPASTRRRRWPTRRERRETQPTESAAEQTPAHSDVQPSAAAEPDRTDTTEISPIPDSAASSTWRDAWGLGPGSEVDDTSGSTDNDGGEQR
ncbi:MAG: hypothetical protein ACK5KU_07345 [Beutenbergiaceae bacterium]